MPQLCQLIFIQDVISLIATSIEKKRNCWSKYTKEIIYRISYSISDT